MTDIDAGPVTLEWHHVLAATWAVHPSLLAARVPAGTTLDLWSGDALLSLVSQRTTDVRAAGVRLCEDFDQVQLRFCVRREVTGETRRGVVVIKQFVASLAGAVAPRLWFNGGVVVADTRHHVESADAGFLGYEWLVDERWQHLSAVRVGKAAMPDEQSIDEFIADRPWVYTRDASGATLEFHTRRQRCEIWRAEDLALDVDVAALLGVEYVPVLSRAPASAFVAVGSAVSLDAGQPIG